MSSQEDIYLCYFLFILTCASNIDGCIVAFHRPFWLTPARDKLNASGLLGEVEAWATASEQLYVLCWKIEIEDQRHNSKLSGYEWWLLQVWMLFLETRGHC